MLKDSPEGQTQYEPAALAPVAWIDEFGYLIKRLPIPVAGLTGTKFIPLYSAATVEQLVLERDKLVAIIKEKKK